MDTTIQKILREHYVEGMFHSHVSVIQPTGKFQFNRQDLEVFWDVYCKKLYENKELVVGIAEKPHPYLPVLVDIDIKKKEEDVSDLVGVTESDEDHDYEISNKLYTENHVKRVIEIYQSVLRNIVDNCTDLDLTCVLLEKDMYRVDKNGVSYLSNGFHLHFPYLFLSNTDQEVHLIPRVQDIIKEEQIFNDLGFEDSGKLVDKACCKVPWLMYGSRKDENLQPYKVTGVYNSECEEITLEDAFKFYKLFDIRERQINIRDNVELYLPRILSIIPYGRETKELKHGLISPLKEKNKAIKKFSSDNKIDVSKALEIAKRLLPLLSSSRVEDRNEWLSIGWILFNSGEGCQEALDLWIDFSSRSEDKFDESVCIYEWERMTKKDLTIRTLRYYASVDNPTEYEKFKREQAEEHLKESLNGSHNDIAKILYAEYGNEFVCSNISSKTWYQFTNHKWELIDDGVFLREKISSDVVSKFTEMGKEFFNKLSLTGDKAEDSTTNNRLKTTQKIVGNLKSAPYKSNVMREAVEVFYDKRFKDKLNTNPHLIAFQNGVYDLKNNIFRNGKPEDFLSKALPIEYHDFRETDDVVQDVHKFLEQVFPDKSVRQYFMDVSSDVFEGGNHQKVVHFWTGEGDNAKSVTQSFFEKMLGPLAVKLPTTALTGKKPSSGSANADMARTGDGVRWVIAEEPDGDEMINTGTLKHLSGNDTYFVRDLFEKGKDTKEVTPLYKLVVICNKLPRMKYADKATWNRIRVIPFESTFCRINDPAPDTYEEQLRQKRFPMDPNFSKKIPELVEAFTWVLLQHRKTVKERFEPEKVRSATEMYRKQNDIYRQFIEESICESNGSQLHLSELYTNFKEWFKESFPGQSIPVKNDIKEFFSKLWGDPTGLRWKDKKIKSLQDNLEDGDAIEFYDEEVVSVK